MYGRGQDQLERREYRAAADTFEALFERFPENDENKAIRESLALNVVDAYRGAYDRSRDVTALERGVAFCDRYESEFRTAYGDVAIAADVQSEFDKLREVDTALHVCLQPCLDVDPCLQPGPRCLQPIEPRRGCGGDGDPGLAAVFLLPLGMRRRRVFERIADKLPTDVAQRLRAQFDDD